MDGTRAIFRIVGALGIGSGAMFVFSSDPKHQGVGIGLVVGGAILLLIGFALPGK